MTLTDTHTHLYSKEFYHDLDDVMSKAIEAGVTNLFLPAIDSETTEDMYALEKRFPDNVRLMMGLHPCSVKPGNYKQELDWVRKQLDERPFYAVGEIGIDLYWDKTTLGIQQEAFQTQIQWAKSMNLPINIHCRDAFDEIFEVLDKENDGNLTGIFHCFTGDLNQAHQAISYGLKLGIGGVVTFKNGKIDHFLSQIPIENIVLETDAPYLAPTPYRGKRNEPAYVALVAGKIAELYQLTIEEVAKITTKNAQNVYKF